MTTYDYAGQRWVSGETGKALFRRQLEEEIATVAGANGAEYLRLTGSTEPVHKVLARLRACLKSL